MNKHKLTGTCLARRPGVRHLILNISAPFQRAAADEAKQLRIALVHLKTPASISTRLCGNYRNWLDEIEAHHTLVKGELAALNQAIEIIDPVTV
jgi:hypothetical protein